MIETGHSKDRYLLFAVCIIAAASAILLSSDTFLIFRDHMATAQTSNAFHSGSGSTPNQAESSYSTVTFHPSLNQKFGLQGQISSSPSVLPERNETQTALVLIPRADGALYTGTLAYHSTRPVEPVVWNVVSPTNATAVIPEEFGGTNDQIRSLVDLNTNRTAQVVLSVLMEASTSGAVPFVGDAIELVAADDSADEPFMITYSLIGQASSPRIVNDLESILNFDGEDLQSNEDEG